MNLLSMLIYKVTACPVHTNCTHANQFNTSNVSGYKFSDIHDVQIVWTTHHSSMSACCSFHFNVGWLSAVIAIVLSSLMEHLCLLYKPFYKRTQKPIHLAYSSLFEEGIVRMIFPLNVYKQAESLLQSLFLTRGWLRCVHGNSTRQP